jgi:hypothetical protein
MRFLTYLVVLLCMVSGLASVAFADAPKSTAPWEESCRHYRSPRHFISESTRFCFRQTNQKECQLLAQRYFERCGFSGDFQKMSAKMGARMLLVLALSSVRSVHHLDL